MKSNLRLSIIIPIYNLELYIEETINSCLNQDVPLSDYEIICVNDGSSDHSLNILNSLASHNSNIKVYDKPNGGVSSARNFGLSKAKGEYIWFVDGDDLVTPNSLGYLFKIANKEKPDVLWFKMRHFSTTPIYNTASESYYVCDESSKIYDFMFSIGGGGVWVNFYRRELLLKLSLKFNENLKYSEDVLFHFSVLLHANKCAKTDSIAYHYRQRQNSAIHNCNPFEFISSMKTLAYQYNSLLKDTDDKNWRIIITRKRDNAVKALIFRLVQTGNINLTRETLRELHNVGFYPYPFNPKSLIYNKTYKEFLINFFSFLFPFKIYTMFIVRIFNNIRK